MTTRAGSAILGTVEAFASGGHAHLPCYTGAEQKLGGVGVRYKLACFDSTGTRHVWESQDVVLADAPALGGGATYTATLVVLGVVT